MALQDSREPEEQAGNETPATGDAYIYHWDYDTQRAYDAREKKKKHRGGVWIYAIVMVLVFGICIGMLAGVMAIASPSSASERDVPDTTEAVAEKVKPQTVLIYASGSMNSGYGTGFFLTSSGYIATNYHVIENMTHVSVTLYSGEVLEARVIGYDREGDLAVIKVDGKNYPAVTLGNSDTLHVGDTAIAIGNPAGTTCSWSTTKGIISAMDRKVTVNTDVTITELTMIQMDTPVNPGNSGGPLCNSRGEVIGIVARKMTDYEGLGLAIPINGASEIIDAIIRNGNAEGVESKIARTRPAIGITASTILKGESFTYGGQQYTAEESGVLVNTVTAGGPASGYLQVADIILTVNGRRVETMDEMIEMLYGFSIGDTVRFEVIRDGERTEVGMKIGVLAK